MTQHRRKSTRLPDWDYASEGWYFVTICAYQGKNLFGETAGDEMALSESGQIAQREWCRSSEIRRELLLDSHVVMPNHMHGIVIFHDAEKPLLRKSQSSLVRAHGRAPLQRPPRSLGSFIAGFKSRTTKRINLHRNTPGTPVWKRGYYDHIIRNQHGLSHIRRYIHQNPTRWALDPYHT